MFDEQYRFVASEKVPESWDPEVIYNLAVPTPDRIVSVLSQIY